MVANSVSLIDLEHLNNLDQLRESKTDSDLSKNILEVSLLNKSSLTLIVEPKLVL